MSGKHTARTLVSPTVLIRFTSPSRAAAIQCSDRLHLNDVKNSPSANKDGGGVFLLTYTKHHLILILNQPIDKSSALSIERLKISIKAG